MFVKKTNMPNPFQNSWIYQVIQLVVANVNLYTLQIDIQEFIQAVLLMSFFWTKIGFWILYNADEVLKVL